MEQQRKLPAMWSSLPQEILIDIFSRHGEDFLFRLAVMGVCKHWRECSRWVDSLVFQYSRFNFKNEHCKVHQAPLDQCGCIDIALSSIFGSSYGLAKLVLQADVVNPSLSLGIWRMLQECDFTHLHGKLETLWCKFPDKVDCANSKIFNNILRCTNLSSLEIKLRKGISKSNFSRVDLSQARELKSLRVCKLENVAFTDAGIRKLVDLCRALEHLEISHSTEMQDPVLDAPNLVDLQFIANCETLTVNAPKLKDFYVNGADEVITEGTCLQYLALASPVALTFTGMINLRGLAITGEHWHMESIMDCLRSVPMITWLHVCPDFEADEEEGPVCMYDFFQGLNELEDLEINVDVIMALDYNWELEGEVFKSLEIAIVCVEDLCLFDEEEHEERDISKIDGIWDFFTKCRVGSRRVIEGESRACREKINAKILEQQRAYYSDPEIRVLLPEID